jgi:hypothetical protein
VQRFVACRAGDAEERDEQESGEGEHGARNGATRSRGGEPSTPLGASKDPAEEKRRVTDELGEQDPTYLARLTAEGGTGGGQVPQRVTHALEDDGPSGALGTAERVLQSHCIIPGESVR